MTAKMIGFDTRDFDRAWRREVERKAPERLLHAVNEAGKDVRAELVRASPVGRAPVRARARLRGLGGARGRGYGPIKKGWSRSRTRSLDEPVIVRNRVFYAPMVEFGTRKMSARPWFRPAIPRVVRVAEDAIDKELRGVTF